MSTIITTEDLYYLKENYAKLKAYLDEQAALISAAAIDASTSVVKVATATPVTVLATDEVIIANLGSAIAINLPAAVAGNVGKVYIIKNIGAGTATINRAGSDTIDGGTSLVLEQNQVTTIIVQAAGVWRTLTLNANIANLVSAAITAANIPGTVDAYLGAAPALLLAALNGDIVMVIEPATTYVIVGEAADGFSEPVTVTFKTAAGLVHSWINGIDLSVSVSDDGAGDSSLSDTTPTVVNGVATFNIIGSAAAWIKGQKATAVIADQVVAAKTVTGGNAVVEITEGT